MTRKIPTIVGALMLTASGALAAPEKVDSELLFLVEIPSDLPNQDFDSLIDNYSKAIQSEAVLSSIQGGVQGSIAASLMFFGGPESQVTAVDWFKIDGKDSAAEFGERIRSTKFPFNASSTSISDGLNRGFDTFSLNSDNGFESSAKIIDITGFHSSTEVKSDGKSSGSIVSSADTDKFASQVLIEKGVTSINGLSLGGEEVGNYYKENIQAGKRSFSFSAQPSDLDKVMATKISTELNNANADAVPEPSSTILIGVGACSLLFRRKR